MTIEDHIKNTLQEFKPVGKKINLQHQNLQEQCNRYYSFKKDENKFKLFIFNERLMLEVKATTKLLFALNLPDLVCFANKLSNMTGHKLFIANSNDDLVKTAVDAINEDILLLNFAITEGMFVYGNAIQLVLNKTRILINEINILSSIKSKLTHESEDQKLDFSGVPIALEGLEPFLNKWAISDDEERDEAISQASKEELEQLNKYVNPKMKTINEYLDSFNNGVMTDEAILIGNLAELVTQINVVKHK